MNIINQIIDEISNHQDYENLTIKQLNILKSILTKYIECTTAEPVDDINNNTNHAISELHCYGISTDEFCNCYYCWWANNQQLRCSVCGCLEDSCPCVNKDEDYIERIRINSVAQNT